MFVPPIDLQSPFAHDPELQQAIWLSVEQLLASGEWASYHAPIHDSLRSEIAARTSTAHIRLCSSGSLAIELALRGAGIKEGDEVICPAMDYPGNIRAIRLMGAVPVVVDTLANRWTIDPEQVASGGTEKTRAVIVSHLYGEIAEVDRLRNLCDERDWKLIEDVCQMPGTFRGGKPLGSYGDVAAFSFGGSKPLTAGSGGAVVTNDARIFQRVAAYADRPSDMFAISAIQAALLLPQWKSLGKLIQHQTNRLQELTSICQPLTPRWQWPVEPREEGLRCIYKVPIVIQTLHPSLEALFQERSICVGNPFRVITRAVSGRGRVVSFANAEQLAQRTVLLDHRYLAGSSESLRSLADRLVAIHHDQA